MLLIWRAALIFQDVWCGNYAKTLQLMSWSCSQCGIHLTSKQKKKKIGEFPYRRSLLSLKRRRLPHFHPPDDVQQRANGAKVCRHLNMWRQVAPNQISTPRSLRFQIVSAVSASCTCCQGRKWLQTASVKTETNNVSPKSHSSALNSWYFVCICVQSAFTLRGIEKMQCTICIIQTL